MSSKELLYIDDALSHVRNMQAAFSSFAAQLQDPELKNPVSSLAAKQDINFNRFMSLL